MIENINDLVYEIEKEFRCVLGSLSNYQTTNIKLEALNHKDTYNRCPIFYSKKYKAIHYIGTSSPLNIIYYVGFKNNNVLTINHCCGEYCDIELSSLRDHKHIIKENYDFWLKSMKKFIELKNKFNYLIDINKIGDKNVIISTDYYRNFKQNLDGISVSVFKNDKHLYSTDLLKALETKKDFKELKKSLENYTKELKSLLKELKDYTKVCKLISNL